MNTDILQKTYDLVDEIKALEVYKELLKLNKIINEDQTILHLVEAFNKQKNKYEEAKKYGKYHPDLKQIQLNLQVAKENLYNNDIIVSYKKCEKEIQSLLNNISKELATTISSKINHPNELGLIQKHKE